ncbi:CDP-diacylglycerol--serine O-phosphatidyltransferase [Hydrogenimonas cancrithermarum]|uniref:CDP-diacylglycerol--serine O-phosphatidyltransferase n=1 Tax=Hydrogenimonas cancrithermarum TaxID=2993563 RepID=A0ABN6WWE6_9BACT|nr:CDP-diacylglycerol--serine O-phosphatidyltransferase [Hydrogenimonas cancrithermarum]BDY13475.1 CDP-diacylglycerol--serine O-phosphatidyltransferase [Hydrogenimonas cancrithermarum]
MGNRNFQFIYILPNLFTAASIFTAVISMVSAAHGQFEKAVWLIFLSLLFDGLDGRVARLTHTTSKFGVEFDSLADIVAFGVAPALLVYFYAGEDYGRFGVLVMALYIIFGAVRLARFNVMSLDTDPTVFIGVPIPTAATFVSVWVLMFERYETLHGFGWLLLSGMLLVSLLMVSNIRYPSFKKLNLKKPMVTKTLILMISLASLMYLYPVEGFTIIISLYILWGVGRTIHTMMTKKRISPKT